MTAKVMTFESQSDNVGKSSRARRLCMSYEEYLCWADEDVLAEWVNGEVIVHMPPKRFHQSLVTFLVKLLGLFVDFYDLGTLLTAPFEMRLSPEGPSRKPDILFVSKEHQDRLTEERLEGPADLVVEVISEDSVRRDRVEKFQEYERFGVREYWVIDSRPGQRSADFWVRGEDGLFAAGEVSEEGIFRSTGLPGFWLKLDWLWSRPLPDPLFTFAEIVGLSEEVVRALREAASRGLASE